MKIAFLDTSVISRYIHNESGRQIFFDPFSKLYASELARVEALRNIDRLRIQNKWPAEEVASRVRLLTAFNAFIEFLPLQPPILRRASEPFSTIIKTLDALHLATAILLEIQLKKSLLFLTHDARQGHAARACGMEAEGF